MKRGFDYLVSSDKVQFDRAVCCALAPLVRASGVVVASYIKRGQSPDIAPILDQPRVGKGGHVFPIHKFVTLDPATKEPFNATAVKLRRFGLDELAQVRNIREGTMHFTGWRPTLPRHYEQFRDLLDPSLRSRHDYLVSISHPGIISSFGVFLHETQGDDIGQDDAMMQDPDGAQVRAEMNLKDAMDASPAHDLKLMERLVGRAIVSLLT